MKKKCTGFRP